MAKFQRPNLPKDITEEERRAAMFDALYSLDLSDKLEKRENDKLSYLSCLGRIQTRLSERRVQNHKEPGVEPSLLQRPGDRNNGIYRGHSGQPKL